MEMKFYILISLLFVVRSVHLAHVLFKCDFGTDTQDNCGGHSSIRSNVHHQNSKHWNVWKHKTPTGATSQTQATGPDKDDFYMYFESSSGRGEDGVFQGHLEFANINIRGRSQLLLTGKYHAFGNDADMMDFDIHVTNVQQGVKDLMGRSKNQKHWLEFKWPLDVIDKNQPISIKFIAKASGPHADYAIDDIQLQFSNGPDCDPACGEGELCDVSSGEPMCTNICETGCGSDSLRCVTSCLSPKCVCDDFFPNAVIENYGDKLESCYLASSTLCDFEYLSVEAKCTVGDTFSYGSTHPSLWHGLNAVSGYRYAFTKADGTITLNIDGQDGKKLTFFYFIGDNSYQVKELSLTIGDETVMLPINQDAPYYWTYFEKTIPDGQTTAKISVSFFGEGSYVGFDSIRSLVQADTQINKMFDMNGVSHECSINDPAPPVHDEVQTYNAMLVYKKYGDRKCICKPFQKTVVVNNKIYCRSIDGSSTITTVVTKPACNVTTPCTGANVECVNNRCVCKDGFISLNGGPEESSHSCIQNGCSGNTCHSSSLCSVTGNLGGSHACVCPTGTVAIDLSDVRTKGCRDQNAQVAVYNCNDQFGFNTQTCNFVSNSHVQDGIEVKFFQTSSRSSDGVADPADGSPATNFFVFKAILQRFLPAGTNPSIIFNTGLNGALTCNFATQKFLLSGKLLVFDATALKGEFDTPTRSNLVGSNYERKTVQITGPMLKFVFTSASPNMTDSGKLLLDSIQCTGAVSPAGPAANPCASHSDCGFAECLVNASGQAYCSCRNGLIDNGGVCELPPLPTETITTTVAGGPCGMCTGHREQCNKAMTACECKPGFKRDETTKKCEPISLCSANVNCGSGLCIDKACLCPSNFMSGNDGCVAGEKPCVGGCAHMGDGAECDGSCGKCKCKEGFVLAGRDNGKLYCDKNSVAELIPDPQEVCSTTCGAGTINTIAVCKAPEYTGYWKCDLKTVTPEPQSCNIGECPTQTCSRMKECTYCDGLEPYPAGSVPKLSLDYNAQISAVFQFLAKWNKENVDKMCKEAKCNETLLQVHIDCVLEDIGKIEQNSNPLSAAQDEMKKILDCNSNGLDHNDWLWEVFDKLCELGAYIPHAVADLNMKKQLLEHEKTRCSEKSKLHDYIYEWQTGENW